MATPAELFLKAESAARARHIARLSRFLTHARSAGADTALTRQVEAELEELMRVEDSLNDHAAPAVT